MKNESESKENFRRNTEQCGMSRKFSGKSPKILKVRGNFLENHQKILADHDLSKNQCSEINGKFSENNRNGADCAENLRKNIRRFLNCAEIFVKTLGTFW